MKPASIEITELAAAPGIIDALSTLLVQVVAAGGSVSFMHPLPIDEAKAFWTGSLAAAARDERVVFGAWQDGALVGTVTLLTAFPPNQPHRAEIAKMMTLKSHRGRGIATRLLHAAEASALKRGKTLLVLDTATDEGASGLYERLGYTLTGEIPNFALKPLGGLTGTLIYWKRIGVSA